MFVAIRERLEKDEDGFTLIELLVVVIIIGILAAIAIPTFLNQRQRGWQAETTSDLRNSAIEVETAATSNGGAYPATFTAPAFGGDTNIGYAVNATNTAFCLFATHDRITGQGQTYSSTTGLSAWLTTAPTTCTP